MASTVSERLRSALGLKRRNVVAWVAIVSVLVVGHVFVTHWAVQYGAYLVAFSVWMIWFVLVVVEVLEEDWS